MSQSTGPSFESFTHLGLDVNELGNTSSFDVSGFREVTFQAELASGSFSTAVLKPQCSADGITFYNVRGFTLTGPGILGEVAVGTEFFRVRVSTVEGSVGTANITVNAKV